MSDAVREEHDGDDDLDHRWDLHLALTSTGSGLPRLLR
jgi:hypothetical protein